jgi:hypothetical protein
MGVATFCAHAQSRGLREDVLRVPVVSGAQRDIIEVTVYRPEGPGPFPIAVLSHGSPRSAAERRAEGRQRMPVQSGAFVAMGFAVLVPTRRGYGESGGEWAETYGSCRNPDYHGAGLESARDIRAAVDAVRGEKWADGALRRRLPRPRALDLQRERSLLRACPRAAHACGVHESRRARRILHRPPDG